MIELNRLGAHGEPVWVNPDLIATIEAHPDTVIVLTTGTKVVVADSVDEVIDRIREWRVSVARGALKPVQPAPTTLA
ncbi:MAG TPA: flagellar FlbD family protein [Solirubrobacteraceae bacterium]|jgi:flagellar protein FlbD